MAKIDISDWGAFHIGGEDGLFVIKKGTRLTKADMIEGPIPFIGASADNNGVTNHIGNRDNLHPGNTITVAYNGSVGTAFFQESEFSASDDINVLYPKFKMNKYIALFICPIIKRAGKKYEFIDKWTREKMETTEIYLPQQKDGSPDWNYMEKYIKKLEGSVNSYLDKLLALAED